jgi:threonine synthase
MRSHYLYRCFDCQKTFTAAEIEDSLTYLCPKCGKAEANQPLEGLLLIEYDYTKIRSNLDSQSFRSFPIGQPWHYPFLWPLDFKRSSNQTHITGFSISGINELSLPSNIFYNIDYWGENLLVLDDSRNPTFSYKDRATILIALKAIQIGITTLSTASTGNAGSSLAGISARLGLQAKIWVPENIPKNKCIQIQAYGAQIHLVKGSYDNAFDLSLKIANKFNWYNRNTAYNPLTIEGKKSAAFDLFIYAGKNMPDYIFVPVGDGVILSGIYKGLWELGQLGLIEKLPRLIGVQSKGSDALVRYMRTGKFIFHPAHTLADSICAGAPRGLFLAANAIDKTDGVAIAIDDDDILEAQKEIASRWGFLVEPAAAASFAGYLEYYKMGRIQKSNKVLLLFTGNGLKDVQAIRHWTEKPKILTPEGWLNHYKYNDYQL